MNKIDLKYVFGFLYFLVYLFSYLYLAIYHQTYNLFLVKIHESGELNFLEVLFYSSHFLAHLPVLVVIAFVFVGCLQLFAGEGFIHKLDVKHMFGLIVLFLLITVLHSFYFYGKTDTLEYILQKKQGHNIYNEGGSWKLHLVSTVSILFLLPLYNFIILKILNIKIEWNKHGFLMLIAGIMLIPFFSFLLEGNFMPDLYFVFTNNRYLAHSVRELITFPITYFPLFFIVFYDLKNIQIPKNLLAQNKILKIVWISFVFFLLLLTYQVISPLIEGIGNLSQKPEFTKGESLPIIYLITSHYFEHFLDTIFFVLLSGFLFLLKNK